MFIPYDDYVRHRGDPVTNGSGRQIGCNRKGHKCVVVPESNIEKRKRQRIENSVFVRIVDDGRHTVGAGQMEQKFLDLSDFIRAQCGALVPSSGLPLHVPLSGGGDGSSPWPKAGHRIDPLPPQACARPAR